MTYKERFEQLLLISIQKSNAFLAIIKKEGQSGTSRYADAKSEWETAEGNFISFLELMESGHINPNARIESPATSFRQRVKNILSLLRGLPDSLKDTMLHTSYPSKVAVV